MLSKIIFSNQKNILHILIFFILPLLTKWILKYFVVISIFNNRKKNTNYKSLNITSKLHSCFEKELVNSDSNLTLAVPTITKTVRSYRTEKLYLTASEVLSVSLILLIFEPGKCMDPCLVQLITLSLSHISFFFFLAISFPFCSYILYS